MHTEAETKHTFMQNRELSWLTFNERVMEEALDDSVPLFERLKFISIFTSNLDEFYMIRVGSLMDLSLMENGNIDNKTGMSPKQQLARIFGRSVSLYQKRDEIFAEIEGKLREHRICNLELKELSKPEKKYIESFYKEHILPILSPQVINSRHPFPHLANKALYIVCEFSGEETKFGLIPVSQSLPEYVLLPGENLRYVMVEKIILQHLPDIFGMYKIRKSTIISVTRNADISADDEGFEVDDNYRERMKKVLKKRAKLSPVRLEVQGSINRVMKNFFLEKLNISKEQIFISRAPLVINYPFQLMNRLPAPLRMELSYPPFEAAYPHGLSKTENITEQCKQKDILLFYPYHQMEPFLRLLKESAEDPNVISIKITLYRLANNSRIIEYLCTAAENNKEVTVLMELKARFDEKNNIEWAERLEEANCNVIYGFEGFKVHTKICLITRRDNNKINYITQVGTGNYNEKTAKLYSDLSLITANFDIGQDAMQYFKNMSLSNLYGIYGHLLVAPHAFKHNITALIEQEITKAKNGEDCGIIIKSNSFTDKDIINKLSEASCAGVEVKLIIRGICCILPGIPDRTGNITVISIVGRFLEHARIYVFGKKEEARMYIASADMMTRNTSRRVEIACPIYDEEARKDIMNYLDVMLRDNVKARYLQSDGTYERVEADDSCPLDCQEYFIKEYSKPHNIMVSSAD